MLNRPIPMTLEDTFELSASGKRLKTRSKNPEKIRFEMSKAMNRQIHLVFEEMSRVVPVLETYTISYDNKNASEAEHCVLRFLILPQNRPMSCEIAKTREDMEGFLDALISCSPTEGALTVEERPSQYIYDLHYKPNDLIDALYNMAQHVIGFDKKQYAPLFLAGHMADRIEDFKPASKIN